MKWFYRIFRSICVTLIALAVAVPLFTYVMLTLPPIQRSMCSRAERELSNLLDTKVKIKSLSIAPFNRVSLRDVTVFDQNNDTVLNVGVILAGVKLSSLFGNDKIIVDYGALIDSEIRLTRATPQSPLNIDPIIQAVSPKERKKRESKFNLAINTVVIRRTSVSYDIASIEQTPDKFNPAHIYISDFNADISLPHMTNNDFAIDINRIAFTSQDELTVNDFHGNFVISDKLLSINNMAINMPDTRLVFDNMSLQFSGWNDIVPSLDRNNLPINIAGGSYINPADFKLFAPHLQSLDVRVDIEVKANGSLNEMKIGQVNINFPGQCLGAQLAGSAGNFHNPDSMTFNLTTCHVTGNGKNIAQTLAQHLKLSPDNAKILSNLGDFSVSSNIKGSVQNAQITSKLKSSIGSVDFSGLYKAASLKHPLLASGNVETHRLNLGRILPQSGLGRISAKIKGDYDFKKYGGNAKANANIKSLEFKGVTHNDLTATATMQNRLVDFSIAIADSLADFSVFGHLNIDPRTPEGTLAVTVGSLNLNGMNLTKDYEGYELSGRLYGSFEGLDPDTAHVDCEISNLKFYAADKPSITMKQLTFKADGGEAPTTMKLRSDFIDATLDGSYSFNQFVPEFKDIAAQIFPILFEEKNNGKSKKATRHIEIENNDIAQGANDFTLDISLNYNDDLNRFLKLPVNVIYPVKFHTRFDSKTRLLAGYLDAPYLQQNNKLIENTHLSFGVDPKLKTFDAAFSTKVPTDDGSMTLKLDCDAADNRLDTYLNWEIDRKREFSGNIDLSTLICEADDTKLMADVSINLSKIIFNDSVWIINPSEVKAQSKRIEVDNFDIRRENQFVVIDGIASENPNDVLKLDLLDVNLDYIFESLGIEKAMIGGDATGSFYASNLFSPDPVITTPGLNVKNISYNKVVFGDALVKSMLDSETRGITLDAVISQPDGQKSVIDGAIYPFSESLDLNFRCNEVPVGFLKPYMSAFTSDVSGYASGYAHLFGTFKYIDLEGEVFAHDLKLKLDFTNTVYSCTDTVKMSSGRIDITDVTLRDMYGHTAKLDGVVTHKFFKEPTFDFRITDARDFLSYDVNSALNPDWYGHIFANGTAHVSGQPGVVDIKIDMTTADNSTFTFVLSDAVEASEYSFVTLRDRRKMAYNDSIEAADPTPKIVKELRKRINMSEDEPSVYNMEFLIGVTPSATLYLVMDPVGGDRIKANGSGNLRMTYGSADEDLRMYGKYTLDRGSYNFTLQDIIIKDFTIKPGSSIAFNGDPYAAQLDISATYSVNANLSDLDESFLQDKDLNRTNVPVHALMHVTGDIHEPEINFDLEFPTLTSDIYRKVRSIVSTDDMMNRQIIYLLALNRFYTPDYMSSTTKGSELVSVASSTISSQLSSILGQLSDNWTITPNIRSDRGDFSDVEFDLALSSNLLNNRLLFNGNFGYRDKTLNTNQFVGDFDLEYLLNKSGSLRLKAYNRYNDQNYYVKTATTTQGIGVMVKKDFDNVFSFFKPLFKRKKKEDKVKKEAVEQPKPTEVVPTEEVVVDDFITIKDKTDEK